ncbi:hypothetical protein NS365_01210 [Aureimonas ureilytica]|uniref:Uncharacterized protein n=1 Tax=Aureimonas ureilytica TaxID=401562 RepID=A0A147DC75_9HYPH|nr:hypothetical protein NS365_01210 [Aureimonas ureilytica]
MGSMFRRWVQWRNARSRRDTAHVFAAANTFLLPYAFIRSIPTEAEIKRRTQSMDFTGGYSEFERLLFADICYSFRDDISELLQRDRRKADE